MNIEEASVELISVDELLRAQVDDEECHKIMEILNGYKMSDYEIDDRGLIVRIAPVDGAVQAFIPKSSGLVPSFLAIILQLLGIREFRGNIIQCVELCTGRP